MSERSASAAQASTDEQTTPPDADGSEPGAASGASSSDLGPPTAVESLVGALLEAGPDVAEHVVKAAQELLLAVQAIVDAADRAVQEQRDVRAAAGTHAAAPETPGDRDAVRHLDLAE
jgi:hypothetical protein